ncbi:MAG: phage terminase small subunit P27 family [Bryobacteraceae bacterium]
MGLRGTISKRTSQLQPTTALTATAAPDYLDDVAAEEWERLVSELKTLSNLDTTILALHCQAFADYRRYSSMLIDAGETYTTPSGQIKFHPAYNGKREAHAQLVKTAAELGFTPNSRARMNIQPATPATDRKSLAEQIAQAKKGNDT